MTRTEAAQICQSIKFILENSDYTEAVEEALNMAIEALEQQGTLQNLTRPNKSDLIVKGAGEIKDGLYNIKDGKLFQYKANVGTVRTYPIVSADRPTGHWVDDDEQQILMKKFIEKGENWKVCNICGAGMRVGAKYDTDKQYHDFFHNFCPNCGSYNGGGE